MSLVTDKQIFDKLRSTIAPMKLTQPVVDMVNDNMKDPVKRAALVTSLGLEQCAFPQFTLNEKTLLAIFPKADVKALPVLLKFAPIFGIVYKSEMAGFLATVLLESKGFKAKTESFAYTPSRLLEVFPSRVKTLNNAKALVAKGQKAIADFLYSNRFGNGANEGWLYRGRGFIMLTFKGNYIVCEQRTGLPIVSNPDLMMQPDIALITALDFWNANDCNTLAKAIKGNDTTALRKRVNGGTNGLAETQEIYIKCMKLL